MEITLEKIELVKDRTGVSYKEAKEALEAADGSVVDAIIAIEETVNIKSGSKAGDFADETFEKVKDLVKMGTDTKISSAPSWLLGEYWPQQSPHLDSSARSNLPKMTEQWWT